MSIRNLSIATIVVLVVAASALGDGRKPLTREEQSKFLISSKAGLVNFVEGAVSLKRGEGDWETLIAGDELKSGDAVKTGSSSHVEVLLNPGSYLRLAENSGFVFTDTSVSDIKLQLTHGSAILEASAVNNLISLSTRHADYSIVLGGLYRFNVDRDGKDEVIVRQGGVIVGASLVLVRGLKVPVDGVEIAEGRQALVGGGDVNEKPVIAKLEKRPNDSFDTWSKARAKTIVAANRKIRTDELGQRAGAMLGAGDWTTAGWWVYNPFANSYTLLPWGMFDVSSPYGFYYRIHLPREEWGRRHNPVQVCCHPRGTAPGPGGVRGGSPGNGGASPGTGGSRPSGTISPTPRGGGTSGGSRHSSGTDRGSGGGAAPSRNSGSRHP